ncbi:hypothetical protein [Methyloglobulus sp.]|uniref:hypothetical protein n=1 Tax=Methyloglobulus sp. TaxID=2518622 RepID=UPI0032B87CA4
MKKLSVTVLVLLVCACNPRPETLSKLPSDAVILAFGDSLTHRTWASTKNDYPSVACRTHSSGCHQSYPAKSALMA